MRASARRSTARSSGGTTRPLSATPTRRRTRPHGGRRRRTRSLRTRTCTGPTRRRRGERPGRSRPRMSTSAARPEACATRTGTPRSLREKRALWRLSHANPDLDAWTLDELLALELAPAESIKWDYVKVERVPHPLRWADIGREVVA